VRSSIDKSYAILNRDASNRQAEFRALLLSIGHEAYRVVYARPLCARPVATRAERVIAAFTDYLVAVYKRGLDVYRAGSWR